MESKDAQLLESIVKAIVDKPKEVKVKRTVDEMGVLLQVEMADDDAGVVIGRGGKTIEAIRRIIGIVGAKNRARISIRLDVPELHK